MPTYFLHVYDDAVARDEDGLELSDDDAALREAVKGARALACEQVAQGKLHLAHRVEIERADGSVLASVSFREAITLVE